MAQLELDAVRQRLGTDLNLTSAVNELSSVLDRKKLLMESLNASVVNSLKMERDEWKQKAERLESERATVETDLQVCFLKSF